jgi:hypothetical protein
MIKLKNILAENMRRFGTKNLSEDADQNNNGYPDNTEVNTTGRRPSIFSGRGPSIQINGPYPEKFFLNDNIATLKNSKKEIANVFKHPNDNDYYVIVKIPYNKRSMTSSYYEIEADTLDELKMELIENEFMLPTENLEQFVIDGNII